ncbi:protein of unknown function [Candidatus Filomicrobium marinum]|uniref:Transposase n=1 Tax=Candidatus Filomicrobium marinum TaxID=1608628 RepID=A0A0D6JGV5_9HYPH|nr:protein of unknown function [Candidatus Filomicrobium marinum]CPR20568.1 protein of unknown function [Candidatus Filomicrobium marinum]
MVERLAAWMATRRHADHGDIHRFALMSHLPVHPEVFERLGAYAIAGLPHKLLQAISAFVGKFRDCVTRPRSLLLTRQNALSRPEKVAPLATIRTARRRFTTVLLWPELSKSAATASPPRVQFCRRVLFRHVQ